MRTKKFKDQRLLLKELLVDYNDIAREGYIWGNGSKFNEKLQNELDTVTNEGYVLPSGLNLTSFRQSLYDYLCNDTKAFISKYDFSDTLDYWILYRANNYYARYARPSISNLNSIITMVECIFGIKCNGVSIQVNKISIDTDQSEYDYICNVSLRRSSNGNDTYDVSIINKDYIQGVPVGKWQIIKELQKTILKTIGEYEV